MQASIAICKSTQSTRRFINPILKSERAFWNSVHEHFSPRVWGDMVPKCRGAAKVLFNTSFIWALPMIHICCVLTLSLAGIRHKTPSHRNHRTHSSQNHGLQNSRHYCSWFIPLALVLAPHRLETYIDINIHICKYTRINIGTWSDIHIILHHKITKLFCFSSWPANSSSQPRRERGEGFLITCKLKGEGA